MKGLFYINEIMNAPKGTTISKNQLRPLLIEDLGLWSNLRREIDIGLSLMFGWQYRCDARVWGWLTPHWHRNGYADEAPWFHNNLTLGLRELPEDSYPLIKRHSHETWRVHLGFGSRRTGITAEAPTPEAAVLIAALKAQVEE